jgi:hypothetical protein
MVKIVCISGSPWRAKKELRRRLEWEAGLRRVVPHATRPKNKNGFGSRTYYPVSTVEFTLLEWAKEFAFTWGNGTRYGVTYGEIFKLGGPGRILLASPRNVGKLKWIVENAGGKMFAVFVRDPEQEESDCRGFDLIVEPPFSELTGEVMRFLI